MAVPRSCTLRNVQQALSTACVLTGAASSVGHDSSSLPLRLLRILPQSIISSSVDRMPNCSIISLLLFSLAWPKWGWFASFLASSISSLCPPPRMMNPFPEGTVFFLEWPTWARLAVVLAGLLTLVLITAFLVKLRNWRKSTILERQAEEENVERGAMTLVDVLSDEIPFGIRALIEDSEVEGIWNTRNITPLQLGQSTRATPPSGSTIRPQEIHSDSSSFRNSTDIAAANPTVLTPFTDSIAVIDPPPAASSSRGKGKALVIRYNGPYIRSEAAETGPDADPSFTQENLGNSTPRMNLRSITNLPSPAPRKFVIGNRQRNMPRHKRAEIHSDVNPLRHMEAHRRFHAAESGQLIPRNRRHTDLVLATPLAPSTSDSEDSDTSSSSRASSWPARDVSMNLGKQLSRRARRMEGPRPIPFRAFVESLPTVKAPPSAWTDKTQARVDAKMPTTVKRSISISNDSVHTSASSPGSTLVEMSPSSTGSTSIANTRSRKINDGFELLPAGSLERAHTVKEFGTWPENSTTKTKPKKLQKRSRSNSGSRSSVDSRRLSGDSFRLPIF